MGLRLEEPQKLQYLRHSYPRVMLHFYLASLPFSATEPHLCHLAFLFPSAHGRVPCSVKGGHPVIFPHMAFSIPSILNPRLSHQKGAYFSNCQTFHTKFSFDKKVQCSNRVENARLQDAYQMSSLQLFSEP